MDLDRRIYVAGHTGLVGSAILRRLEAGGFQDLITRTHAQLDLCDGRAVEDFFAHERPELVFVAAAKVGGILANHRAPADFIRVNLQIQTNVLDAAWRHGVAKLLLLGSSCIYPRAAPQPLTEDALLSGPLEATNAPYAVAKIAGLTMCQSYNRQYGTRFIGAMPPNVYGPNDRFDPDASHVVPAMIHKLHEAKAAGRPYVTLWGTGTPRRELLHADDLADACLHLMEHFEPTEGRCFLNVGTGEDLTIRELAELVREVVGYGGEILWDPSRPDGTPRKVLEVSGVRALGWRPRIALRDGVADTYRWYLAHVAQA